MNAIAKRLAACLLLLTLCLAALPGLGEAAPAYDFKKFRWGDSHAQVFGQDERLGCQLLLIKKAAIMKTEIH